MEDTWEGTKYAVDQWEWTINGREWRGMEGNGMEWVEGCGDFQRQIVITSEWTRGTRDAIDEQSNWNRGSFVHSVKIFVILRKIWYGGTYNIEMLTILSISIKTVSPEISLHESVPSTATSDTLLLLRSMLCCSSHFLPLNQSVYGRGTEATKEQLFSFWKWYSNNNFCANAFLML